MIKTQLIYIDQLPSAKRAHRCGKHMETHGPMVSPGTSSTKSKDRFGHGIPLGLHPFLGTALFWCDGRFTNESGHSTGSIYSNGWFLCIWAFRTRIQGVNSTHSAIQDSFYLGGLTFPTHPIESYQIHTKQLQLLTFRADVPGSATGNVRYTLTFLDFHVANWTTSMLSWKCWGTWWENGGSMMGKWCAKPVLQAPKWTKVWSSFTMGCSLHKNGVNVVVWRYLRQRLGILRLSGRFKKHTRTENQPHFVTSPFSG